MDVEQNTAAEVQRNVNQQQRIEQGPQSGQLSTREAAGLERGQARIEKLEANANRDGTLTPAEKAQARTNERTGNPDSASSKRMQADVQRNVNQQKRIEQGVQDRKSVV